MKSITLPAASSDDIRGFGLFSQYTDCAPVKDFFHLIKKEIFDNTNARLALLNQIGYKCPGNNDYLQFYYENIYGFKRAFGEPLANNLYDTGKKYDGGIIYDDSTYDGYQSLGSYKTLIKFFFDYSEKSFTIGWLYRLIMEFCDIPAKEIKITPNAYGVQVNLKLTYSTLQLKRIFDNLEDCGLQPLNDVIFNVTEKD